MNYDKILHYNILNKININIEIRENKYDIPADTLFKMAARKNPKRSFLFVSRILGKHIPVNPLVSLLGGAALGAIYAERICKQEALDIREIVSAIKDRRNRPEIYDKIMKKPLELMEPTLFIGFAETATALGHSVFNCFKEGGFYIHTTREDIVENKEVITFEEEHSHATSHRIYPFSFPILASKSPVVLIDDEITTGKTSLNIIAAIHKLFPRKSYTILSLLDWRTEGDREDFRKVERDLGIKINVLSLISGTIDVDGKPINEIIGGKNEDLPVDNEINIETIYLDTFFKQRMSYLRAEYLRYGGRFGISTEEDKVLDKEIRRSGEFLREHRGKGKILCMGTGEFMYIPMKIASYMGEDVLFQSTTRSPIHPQNVTDYGVKNSFVFKNPEDLTITNYFYNIPYKYYNELYLFLEKEPKEEDMKSLLCQLKRLGIKNINIIIFTRNEKDGVKNA